MAPLVAKLTPSVIGLNLIAILAIGIMAHSRLGTRDRGNLMAANVVGGEKTIM